MKPLYQYEKESPVLSLDMNSFGQLAVGNMDRLARVYEANPPFGFLGSTKSETKEITLLKRKEKFFIIT